MQINGVTIIIPTWKRNSILKKILQSLLYHQTFKLIKYEIIIVDSSKNRNLEIVNDKNIRYFNYLRNSNASKRNFGLSKAKFNNIILLDDDCVPSKFFLFHYYRLFRSLNERVVINGSVKYNEIDIKQNRYINYREKSHFIVTSKTNLISENLSPSLVVTMNMGFKFYKNKPQIYFNEKFGNYGFEDYEFSYRLQKKSFKFFKGCPLVIHNEKRSFEKYLNKFYYLGNVSSKIFADIDLKAFSTSNYYKIENFFIIKIIKNSIFFIRLIIILGKICLHLNRFTHYNFRFLIKLNIIFFYLLGFLDRKNNINRTLSWYL